MQIKSILCKVLIGLLAAAPLATGHSWVEQMMVIAPNGTLVGEPGFARGNVLRGSAGFSDPTMVNLLPPDGRAINQIQSSDLMCKSSQTSSTQTDGSPRLQAAAGDAVALRYQENGHVTLPDNQPGKPQNRGTVYVYGTTHPSPDDSFLAIHRVWNADGTGGDGRGRLLSTRNFDDGQCYQTNGGQISQQRQQQYKHDADKLMGADLWCQQDIQLPSDASSGKPYTLYWVWDWPTMPGTSGFPDGKQEIYTTCMDIDIVDDTGIVPVSRSQVSYAQGQPLDNAAVSAQMTDLADPTAVTGQTIPFSSGVPTTFLTQTASSPSTTTPSLTSASLTGSSIAFSASATGPAAGGASEASISAATASETGVPGFLSVHTGSTAGPGAETQTFTVIPISVTATDSSQSQPTDGGNGNGRGGGRGGDGNGKSSLSPLFTPLSKMLDSSPTETDPSTGPQVTAVPNAAGNAQVATFTEYDSVTQTVLQTVYLTKYTKRDAGESFSPTSSPAPSSHQHNGTHPHPGTYSWSPSGSARFNFTHPTGSPPWTSGAWASGTGHARPTGWSRQNSSSGAGHDGNSSSGNYATTETDRTTITVPSVVSLTTYLPSASADAPAAVSVVPVSPPPALSSDEGTTQSTVTIGGTLTMTTSLPSATPPDATATSSPEAIPASAFTDMGTNTPPPSPPFSSTSTLTTIVTITPTDVATSLPSDPSSTSPSSASIAPSNTSGDQSLTFTVAPIPDPTATPSPTTSTDHPAFRLRARNPFVALGWMSEPKTTQSS